MGAQANGLCHTSPRAKCRSERDGAPGSTTREMRSQAKGLVHKAPVQDKSQNDQQHFTFASAGSWLMLPWRPGKMNPDDALHEQIERYRRMTGEQRLALALELHELSCNVAREGIRRQNPNANEAEVERLLRERLRLART